MRIDELRLTNFRKFDAATFCFNTQTGVTVLNGKTGILDALAIMMGSYLLDFKANETRHILKDEARLNLNGETGLITALTKLRLSTTIRGYDLNPLGKISPSDSAAPTYPQKTR